MMCLFFCSTVSLPYTYLPVTHITAYAFYITFTVSKCNPCKNIGKAKGDGYIFAYRLKGQSFVSVINRKSRCGVKKRPA